MTQQPPAPPRPPDGARYADDRHRYRLDARIATGGMGEVWRGTDTSLSRPVAVKLLKSEYADDPTFRSRFETEARHAAALHHSGVAAIYDVGEARSTDVAAGGDGSGMPRPFLVMELVDGQPLSALLRGGRAMDADVVSDLLAQAGDAVGVAHRAGIVHRDLKPANLMVTPDRTVKITDFGIARATDGLGLTGTGQVMGTPQYLSPEQARGNPATPASDVYSLGVVAFECLVGRRPFEAESPVATALAHLNDPVPTLPASIPADLAGVVRRALAKKPEERFPDGAAFAAALRDPAGAGAAVATGRTGVTRVVAAAQEPPAERTQMLPATSAQPLPPVAPAPPVDADPAAGEDARSPWPIVVLLVAVLAVAAVIVALLVDRSHDDTANTGQTGSPSPSAAQTTATTSSASTSSSPSTFSLEESDYLGRNVDDVVAELKDRGLRPDVEDRANPGGEEADTVISVDPTSDLQQGDSVTVVYWDEAEPSPSATPTPSPSPSASQTPTPSASQTPSASTSPSAGGSASGATDSETPSDDTSPAGA